MPAKVEDNTEHAYHLYTILIDEKRVGFTRDQMLNKLNELGIGCGVHYLSVPDHPFYQRSYMWDPADYPNAKKVGDQTLSIPLSPKLSNQQIEYIMSSVRDIVKCH